MEDVNKKIISKKSGLYVLRGIFAFTVGALCAAAYMPYSLNPFGIAVCSAVKKNPAVSAGLICGAVCAYILIGAPPVYIAALLITIPLKIIIQYFLPQKHRNLCAPICALITLTFIYLTQYIQYGFLTYDLITGISGIILGTVFTVAAQSTVSTLFSEQKYYTEATDRQTLMLIIFLSILSIYPQTLTVAGISPMRILLITLALLVIRCKSKGMGMASAVIFSLSFIIVNKDLAYLTPAYALGALSASLMPNKNRYSAPFLYLAAFGIFAVYLNGDIQTLGAITEVGAGCFLYIFIPDSILSFFAKQLCLYNGSNITGSQNKLLMSRLNGAAGAMEEISKALIHDTDNTITDIYKEVSDIEESVCRGCKRSSHCWGANYNTTKDVFNKAANRINKKLTFSPSDLPEYFTKECCQYERICKILTGIAGRRQGALLNKQSTTASRKIIAAQYEYLSFFIKELCENANDFLRPDAEAIQTAYEYFNSLGIVCKELSAYYDSHLAIHIEATLKSEQRLYEIKLCRGLSQVFGQNIACKELIKYEDIYKAVFCADEKYSITVAQTNRSKSGERVCGDSFLAFKSKSSRQILALADGMGSGAEADELSTLTLEILKNLLQSGFPEAKACSLINSTLLLGGDGQSFSTLDMTSIDLYSGVADFYKLGAAPTLILRNFKAYEICCPSLPAGIMGECKAEHKNCRLKDGDTIIMLSDGVDINEKILDICAKHANDSPITLCEKIMENATVEGKTDDDMTVAIAKITNKKSA